MATHSTTSMTAGDIFKLSEAARITRIFSLAHSRKKFRVCVHLIPVSFKAHLFDKVIGQIMHLAATTENKAQSLAALV